MGSAGPVSGPQEGLLLVRGSRVSPLQAAGGPKAPGKEPAPTFPVSAEQRQQLREAFDTFDPDGSGLIDVKDLKAGSRENAACSLVKWKHGERSEGCAV